MPLILKVIGYILLFLFPFIFLIVSIGTDNFRYFFYALAASIAAILTGFILKRIK